MNVGDKKYQLFNSIKSVYPVDESENKVSFVVDDYNVDICVCEEVNMVLIELSKEITSTINKNYSKVLNTINTSTKTITHTLVDDNLYTCRSMLEMNMLIPIDKFKETLKKLLYDALTATVLISI